MRYFLTHQKVTKNVPKEKTMEERTLSITIGSGDIRHNNRLFKPSNVDHSRTPDNITLVREDIQDAYHRLFNDSVTKYNELQKRNDRKIKNYFDKIYRSKKEKPFYEFIAQVGNQGDQPDQKKCVEILEDFHKMMQKDYPNMAIFNSVIHVDESTPHLHLDFIPIGEGYKKGLEKRVSMQKALQNLGFSNYADFRNELMQKFEEIAKKHEIERKRDVAIGERHLTIQDYRALQRMAEQKIESLDKTSVSRSSSRVLEKLKLVPVAMFDDISRDNTYRKEQNKALTSENDALRAQISKLKTKNNIDTYEAVIENQKNMIERLEVVLKEKKEERSKYYNKYGNARKTIEKMGEKLELEKQSNKQLKELIQNNEKSVSEAKKTQDENKKLKAEVDKLKNKLDDQWSTNNSTRMLNVDLKREIKNKTDENASLKKEITALEAQNRDMRANINRHDRLFDVLRKCSLGRNFDKMTQLISLAACGQEEEMERELDEFYYRASHTQMRQ